MTAFTGTPATDPDVARLAYEIWEAEGRPDGRDQEHWFRAKKIIEGGDAQADPDAAADPGDETGPHAARPVRPGFEDVRPGIVPAMKEDARTELREEPGGRFAKQIADLPEESASDPTRLETPGPRNPTPIPSTNDQGHVSISSVDDAAGGGLNDEPAPRPAPR